MVNDTFLHLKNDKIVGYNLKLIYLCINLPVIDINS